MPSPVLPRAVQPLTLDPEPARIPAPESKFGFAFVLVCPAALQPVRVQPGEATMPRETAALLVLP